MTSRAHGSMAEQPAHNRLDLGSSPGGPTVVPGSARPARTVGGLRQTRVAHFVAGSARPARTVGGLRQTRVAHFVAGSARPARTVGGLPQVRVAPHPRTTRTVRVA